MLDNFPSASNMARLGFLIDPSYFVMRVMTLPGLLLIFGLMFILSNRLKGDEKCGVKILFMAAPLRKADYLAGKLTGNFLYAVTIFSLFLLVNITVYAAFSPVTNSIGTYLRPFITALLYTVVPACVFLTSCAVLIPAIVDMRLFYLGFAALFAINTITVVSAEKVPFYLILQGELRKITWHHPEWNSFYIESAIENLCFLLGIGLAVVFVVALKRNFWRAE
jgi:hypothetical protein